jgi:hypothetical protein
MKNLKKIGMYSDDIDLFMRSQYYKDAEEFLSIVILDIDNNIYENIMDLAAQIPFLKKREIEMLKSHFSFKKQLRMVA